MIENTGSSPDIAARRAGRRWGFALIEVLVLAGIVVIFAALVLSVWHTHIIRRQVALGVESAAGLKMQVVEFHAELGEWPRDRPDLGLAANPAASRSSYVEGIDIDHGYLRIRFGRRAHAMIAGRELVLAPIPDGEDGHAWRCIQPGDEPATGDSPEALMAFALQPGFLPLPCRR